MKSKEELMAMVDFKEPTYFVGYGSLMYPSGINGRGMEKYYDWSDLIPITLRGFRRSFCTLFKDLAFYGIYRDEGSEINAVAFKIESLHDYTMLLLDEQAHPVIKPAMYTPLNVVDLITTGQDNFADDSQVMVLEAKHIDEKAGYLPEYYIAGTWEGIQYWGQDFTDKFLKTGGVKYSGTEKFNIKVSNPWNSFGSVIYCAERY